VVKASLVFIVLPHFTNIAKAENQTTVNIAFYFIYLLLLLFFYFIFEKYAQEIVVQNTKLTTFIAGLSTLFPT